MQNGKNNIIR